jgi:hypothetical protein
MVYLDVAGEYAGLCEIQLRNGIGHGKNGIGEVRSIVSAERRSDSTPGVSAYISA